MNQPYPHDPRIAELDAELDRLDAERLVALAEFKERGRELMAERADLLMVEQLTLRRLNKSPLSVGEQKWVEANPEEWDAIKAATAGKVGSRTPQHAEAK